MTLQDALAFKLPSIPDDVETIVSVAQREEEVTIPDLFPSRAHLLTPTGVLLQNSYTKVWRR